MSQSEQDKYSKFNALLDRHKAQIENMCTRRSRGEYNLFAELRQECYISIWKHQDSLRADANIMQDKNGRIIILGGNQSDALNTSPNDMSLLLKCVYPSDYAPTDLSLPTLIVNNRQLDHNSTR